MYGIEIIKLQRTVKLRLHFAFVIIVLIYTRKDQQALQSVPTSYKLKQIKDEALSLSNMRFIHYREFKLKVFSTKKHSDEIKSQF